MWEVQGLKAQNVQKYDSISTPLGLGQNMNGRACNFRVLFKTHVSNTAKPILRGVGTSGGQGPAAALSQGAMASWSRSEEAAAAGGWRSGGRILGLAERAGVDGICHVSGS